MSQRRSSRRRNLPPRLQDCDLSGGFNVERTVVDGQQGDEGLNWVDDVENGDEEEIFADAEDRVCGDQVESHQSEHEDLGGQRGGGRAQGAFDERPSQAKARAKTELLRIKGKVSNLKMRIL